MNPIGPCKKKDENLGEVVWDVKEQLWEVAIILQEQRQNDEWDVDEQCEGDFEVKGNHGDGFDEGKQKQYNDELWELCKDNNC